MSKMISQQDSNSLHSVISNLSLEQRNALNLQLTELGESLLEQLTLTLGSITELQKKNLQPKQHDETINKIYASCTKMLENVTKLLQQASIDLDGNLQNTSDGFAPVLLPSPELLDVPTLIVDDNLASRAKLETQLTALGLACKTSTVENTLQAIYNAAHEHHPFQIVVIRCNQYDHHIAYLGRMMKANPTFSALMKCLALPNELLDYDRERAHFDGFACVLNLSKIDRLMTKLENSWKGWSAKLNFSGTKLQTKVGKNRILLVEDDPIPQKVTQWQLSELGFTVDTAPDGQTALKLLQKNSYDLVFMDIGLPDISGLEVTQEFRKRETNSKHTPIIGLTVYALSSDEKSGLEAGMDEYLVKPLQPQRLKNLLQHWGLSKE